jgi:hypothetical protein
VRRDERQARIGVGGQQLRDRAGGLVAVDERLRRDEPRVNVTFSSPGYVSRRSSIAAVCASPCVIWPALSMNTGLTL